MANDSVRGVSTADSAARAQAARAAAASGSGTPPHDTEIRPTERQPRRLSIASDLNLTGNPGASGFTDAPEAATPTAQASDVGTDNNSDHAEAPRSRPHGIRDVVLPVVGQLLTWGGGAALLSYGFARIGDPGDTENAKTIAGFAGGITGGLGLLGVGAGAYEQRKDAPKHADANPGVRWAKALAWGALGTALVAGAGAGIPDMEGKRKFEVKDRDDTPENGFPRTDQYQVISPGVNVTASSDIRPYIYHGNEGSSKLPSEVKDTAQAAYFDFLSYPPIKSALGVKGNSSDVDVTLDLTVKYNKIEYGKYTGYINQNGPSVFAKRDKATEPQTPVVVNLGKVWKEATPYFPNDVIKKSERPQYGLLAAHDLRLHMHAALMVKFQNPDFLKGYNNTGGAGSTREEMAGAMFRAMTIDSFKRVPPKVNDGDGGFNQNQTIDGIFSGNSYNKACPDKPCASGDEKSFTSIAQDVISQLGREIFYNAAFGNPKRNKTKVANLAVLDAIPPLFATILPPLSPEPSASASPSPSPSPSPTPYPSPIPESPQPIPSPTPSPRPEAVALV
jgi:hypothetical protein